MKEDLLDKAWAVTDVITTDCPFCAFCRGVVIGTLLTALFVWFIAR